MQSVDEAPASRREALPGEPQEVERARIPPLRRAREQATDIAEPGRAERRIDQHVADDAGVRVPFEAALGRHLDAAEHERAAVHEPVRVDRGADPQRRHGSGTSRRSRCRKRASER